MFNKTKKALFDFMQRPPYNLEAAAVFEKLKSCNCKIPFDVKEWNNYVSCLTVLEPCEICGAPRAYDEGLSTHICMYRRAHHFEIENKKRRCVYCGSPVRFVADRQGFFHLDGWVCIRSTSHYYLQATEKLMIASGMTANEAREMCLDKCGHGVMKFECPNCIGVQIERNMAEVPV